MYTEIRGADDMICVEDVTVRVEYLREEREGLQEAIDSAQNTLNADPENDDKADDFAEALKDMREWESDRNSELTDLDALLSELAGKGGCTEWEGEWYPSLLVNDSYFEEFARQEAVGLGYAKDSSSWPYNCIDWERAAYLLRQDYIPVDFDGATFWYRV